tara:strand:- start:44 stop:691 length:648 start_codon:yes stop_codon:yes gene_type:complete
MLNIYFKAYIAICVLLFFIGLFLSVKRFNYLELYSKAYWSFLAKPWKLITFIIAFISFNLIGPFSGDPTWDLYTSSAMSILTYLSAPWSIGIFYKFLKNKSNKTTLFIAFIALMFSVSWCYDWYLVIKQGSYPETWFANIFLSSIVYIAAGLYWNIEFRLTKGITIAFLYDDWLISNVTDYSFKKIWWVILITTLPVAVLFISFLFTIGVFSRFF